MRISEISYLSFYQNFTAGNFMFFDEKLSKTIEPICLKPGLSFPLTDIVGTMNALIRERNNHGDTCIRVKVTRVTQKN